MFFDNIIIFLYLILILFVGIYHRARHSSFKNYANVSDGNAKKSRLLLVATIFTSAVGGATTFGIAEKTFLGHIYYGYALILTIPIDILIATYIVPRIAKHYGAETIGDIMYKYYGNSGRFISGISSIILSLGFLAAQISVSGYIFQYILKIDYIEGVILSYTIVLIYTTIGGLQSILFTNLIQFFAMIVAIPIITIIGIYKIGFINFTVPLNDNIQSDLFAYIVFTTLSFSIMNLYPNFVQRALINKNSAQTTKAIYIKSAIYLLFLICITFNGLIAYNFYPDQPSNLVLPYLINQIIPPVIKGIVITGLLAAVMSTADSDLNITSISLVKDILSPIFHVQNQQKLLLIARIINIVIGSFAIVIALKFNSVVDLIVFITGFWGPVVLVPFIMALFNIVVPVTVMILSSVIGGGAFLIWDQLNLAGQYFGLKGVFIGTATSLITFTLWLIVQFGKNRLR